MARYALPRDTCAAFLQVGGACQNAGLVFERYLPILGGRDRERTDLKDQALKSVLRCRQDADLICAHLARWQAVVRQAGAAPFRATTEWRFITGLGRKGALEIGFHFHPLYGFPVIPGSGLKGLARSWALLGAGLSERDPAFREVFGGGPEKGRPQPNGQIGGAIFFDAVPEGPVSLELDVINPHYPDYYRPADRQAPANWQSPVPVLFLAVPAGTRFWFAVGWRGQEDRGAQASAVEWLQAGLRRLGAGAKTGAGYGYWEIPAGDS